MRAAEECGTASISARPRLRCRLRLCQLLSTLRKGTVPAGVGASSPMPRGHAIERCGAAGKLLEGGGL